MAGKAGVWRPWTDEEYGLLEDHGNKPTKWLAEALDRSPDSVRGKLRQLRSDWSPVSDQEEWTRDELFTVRTTGHLTAQQVADLLPGRTAKAVSHKRSALNVKAGINKDPSAVGARLLIARTCNHCGLLLSAKWFLRDKDGPQGRYWKTTCRKCHPSRVRNGRNDEKPTSAESRKRERSLVAAKQRLTLQSADRKYLPWIESDHETLADPDLTLLEKALRLKRTYVAVVSIAAKHGYYSKNGLGNPAQDEWSIDNPNDPRLQDAT